MEMNIWRGVATNAAASHGNGLPAPSSSAAVLLQPGLPSSVQEAHAALPSMEPRVVASLRRRLWQRHIASLHARDGEDIPRSTRPLPDTNLYLLQTDENVGVEVVSGNPPARRAPVRGEVHSRRRLRLPRRVPVEVADLVEAPAPLSDTLPTAVDSHGASMLSATVLVTSATSESLGTEMAPVVGSASSEAPASSEDRVRRRHARFRDRSRSRDDVGRGGSV